MKRHFAICLLCALCLLLFFGCGQKSESNTVNGTIKESADTSKAEADTTVTGVEGSRNETMSGDDGSLWAFEDNGEVTVTAKDGSKRVYTYRLTSVTVYLTDTTTGEEIEAEAEYDDDGSITLFFDDGSAVVLASEPS